MLQINPKFLFPICAALIIISGICFFQVDGDYNEGVWILLGSFFAAMGLSLGYHIYKVSKNK